MTDDQQLMDQSTQELFALTDIWPNPRKRIEDGRITPFVSNYMSAALFSIPRGELAKRWAKEIHSPFGEADNREIAHVAQYYAVTHGNSRSGAKQNYLNFLTNYLLGRASQDPSVPQQRVQDLQAEFKQLKGFKKSFSEIAQEQGYPRFDTVEANPFRMLAEMPLRVYITTSHHQFLEYALAQTQNKKPVSAIFQWNDDLNVESFLDKNPDWEPSVEQPLVYHLYGLDSELDSMVLTEDDFLDLLVSLLDLRYQVRTTEAPAQNAPRRRRSLPAAVSMALNSNALLTLGYHVVTWEFRVLLRGFILPNGEGRQSGRVPDGICMQFKSSELDAMQGDPGGIRSYLEQYFGNVHFRVFWGSVESCVRGLYDLLQVQPLR